VAVQAVNVIFEQIAAVLVACPRLTPRPTATDIRAFVVKRVAVLSGIPSQQSAAYVYTNICEQLEVYSTFSQASPSCVTLTTPSPSDSR
jgi:hypothetical protein